MQNHIENTTGALFGSLWKDLSSDQFKESVELFTKRAQANNFDLEWLQGKTCLDAGCGSGRYSVALALHGAREITAVDVSSSGLETAKANAKEFDQIQFQQASVLDLPFPNESFDLVWCAGVLMITSDFDKGLAELTRVLKPNGKLFLLVYGAGGLRWKAIKAARPIVTDLGEEFIDKAIQKSGLPANNRKNYMDDLFVPIQKLTKFIDLNQKLINLGYSHVDRWTGNTFDHENSPEDQLEDMLKLDLIAESAQSIATTPLEKHLSKLLKLTAHMYVKVIKESMADSNLTPEQRKDITIGEGNLRLIAIK
ncbi:MAG: class I SAM-dependent methyltransferase [SAR202 cluster bacterium]|nr:class I SAM-dependent methyltransferase [SAR202 cluster bacterium]MQG07569.1 class I SAM-dependent methyltransferase [SAR202 cluster bacterium]|tara:strand:- start:1825 stop:2754 length:930 start_codon:yes stop_codon:yes gene_type:complete